MIKITQYIFKILDKLRITRLFPDSLFLKWQYYIRMNGRKLNLKNPKSFSEKLQWLKINQKNPLYTSMVDKYEVKKLVGKLIGNRYVIPTIDVWDTFEDINFEKLPNQFVLKCTHDSGGLVICQDKSQINYYETKKKIVSCLKRNFYYNNREWPYKNVRARVIAEKYMQNNDSSELIDYKFYCFNGVPKFLYISKGLENHSTASISFLNLDWTFSSYERNDYKQFDKLPSKPNNFKEMLNIAKILSAKIPFLRVDLYEINNQVYFSEMTFSPVGGYMQFKNIEHDYEVGDLLVLPKN